MVVINPTPIMEKMEQSAVWGEDPVHPKDEFYKKLASMALGSLERATEKADNQQPPPYGKRPRGPEWRENRNNYPGGGPPGMEGRERPPRRRRRRPRPYGGLRQRWPEILRPLVSSTAVLV